jgi:hypothetical protein
MGCGLDIPKCSVKQHIEFDCAQRVVRCQGLLKHNAAAVEKNAEAPSYYLPPTGCGKQLPLKSLSYHLKHDCPHEQAKEGLAKASNDRRSEPNATHRLQESNAPALTAALTKTCPANML